MKIPNAVPSNGVLITFRTLSAHEWAGSHAAPPTRASITHSLRRPRLGSRVCWPRRSSRTFAHGWRCRWRLCWAASIRSWSTTLWTASERASADSPLRVSCVRIRAHPSHASLSSETCWYKASFVRLRAYLSSTHTAQLMPSLGGEAPKFVESLYRKVLEVIKLSASKI